MGSGSDGQTCWRVVNRTCRHNYRPGGKQCQPGGARHELLAVTHLVNSKNLGTCQSATQTRGRQDANHVPNWKIGLPRGLNIAHDLRRITRLESNPRSSWHPHCRRDDKSRLSRPEGRVGVPAGCTAASRRRRPLQPALYADMLVHRCRGTAQHRAVSANNRGRNLANLGLG